MPSMPPAPALLSTTTGCFQRSFSLSPSVRTMTSSELPAGAGTTMRTGLVGQALRAGGRGARLQAKREGERVVFIGVSLVVIDASFLVAGRRYFKD